jgi:hypothetical protein
MYALLLVGIAALALSAGYYRLRTRPVAETVFYVVRCPACAQKVRYPAHTAGGSGLCPRCLRQVALPDTPQPLARPAAPHRVGQRMLQKTA